MCRTEGDLGKLNGSNRLKSGLVKVLVRVYGSIDCVVILRPYASPVGVLGKTKNYFSGAKMVEALKNQRERRYEGLQE